MEDETVTNRLVGTDTIEVLAAPPKHDDFGTQTAAEVGPQIDQSLEAMVRGATAQPVDGVLFYDSELGRDLRRRNRMFQFENVDAKGLLKLINDSRNNIRAIVMGKYDERLIMEILTSPKGNIPIYLDMKKRILPEEYAAAVKFIPQGQNSPDRPKILAEIIGYSLPKDSVDRKTGYKLTEDMFQGYNDLTTLRTQFQKAYGTVVGMMITNGSLGKPKGDAELYVQKDGNMITYKLTQLVKENIGAYIRALTGLAILAVEHSKAHGTKHYSNSQTALQRIGALLGHLDKRNNYAGIRAELGNQ
ncbi:TPA: hypothetical protein HA246_00465 [Candidatus Woesearchaeota archaeon]|nr:hypothetical protein [Candidatus Woesearchaeota archaeon]